MHGLRSMIDYRLSPPAMTDSPAAGCGFIRLRVPDAELFYAEEAPLGQSPLTLLEHLIDEVPWRRESIVLWGRNYLQPRLSAWYGDPHARYRYSGMTLEPLPWSSLLAQIRLRVETLSRHSFNSVLLNYYRDNRDSMGFHSDDEPELGEAPTIASVSVGHERTFILRHKARKDLSPVRLRMKSGSLLLMTGPTQRFWVHGIPKESQRCGPRVNLTFRRIVRPTGPPASTGS